MRAIGFFEVDEIGAVVDDGDDHGPFVGQGFGLGVSVITDPEKQAWMGAGSAGAFGWPGAFGTWWQADPEEDLILIYLIQNSMELGPESASQVATGQRMGARAALPIFQKPTSAALGKGPPLF